MKLAWETDGEANADGLFVATIDTEDGRGIQRFEGKSHKDVADKLLNAQANATRKIAELDEARRASLTPVHETPIETHKPQALTGDERVRLTTELQSPATAPEAVARIVEAATGTSLKKLSQNLSDDDLAEAKRQVREAADAFRAETPEYIFCDFNSQAMRNYFLNNRLDFRAKNNYHIAFRELKKAGLLQLQAAAPASEPAPAPARSSEEREEPERIAPTTRPRGAVASSGLRSEHSSAGVPAARPKQDSTLTRQDIEEMDSATYEKRYREEPTFRRIVDELYAPRARAAR
jgi:hypothetical protein